MTNQSSGTSITPPANHKQIKHNPRARFHDFSAIDEADTWTDRAADGFQLSASVKLMATPGHTAEDIITLVETSDGLVACTHLWWSEQGPAQDPLAEDQAALERSRARLLELEPSLIVPGNGAPFRPNPAHLS